MRSNHHQKRGNDPVEQDTEAYLDPKLLRSESLVQGLVLDFAQNWVHHNKQADCCLQACNVSWRTCSKVPDMLRTNRDGNSNKFALLERWACTGNEIAKQNADYHSEQDPERKQAI